MESARVRVPECHYRYEYFGGFAWLAGARPFFRLSRCATIVLAAHDHPLPLELGGDMVQVLSGAGISEPEWLEAVGELSDAGLLTAADALGSSGIESVTVAIKDSARLTPGQQIMKPLWVHLQPFTRCNQHCIHCYCAGGRSADGLQFGVEVWHEIIRKLETYGVRDIYITGGETLMYRETFELAEDILERGLGFGLSTNATIEGYS